VTLAASTVDGENQQSFTATQSAFLHVAGRPLPLHHKKEPYRCTTVCYAHILVLSSVSPLPYCQFGCCHAVWCRLSDSTVATAARRPPSGQYVP
jgi:hypothetical protein